VSNKWAVEKKPTDLHVFSQNELALVVVEEPEGLARCLVAGGDGIELKSSLALLDERRERPWREDIVCDDSDAAHVVGGADEDGRADAQALHHAFCFEHLDMGTFEIGFGLEDIWGHNTNFWRNWVMSQNVLDFSVSGNEEITRIPLRDEQICFFLTRPVILSDKEDDGVGFYRCICVQKIVRGVLEQDEQDCQT